MRTMLLTVSPFFTTTVNRRNLFWILQAAGWGGLLVVGLGVAVYLPIGQAVVLDVFRSLFGLVATSFLLRPFLRWMRRRSRDIPRMGLIGLVGMCLLLGLVDTWTTGGMAQSLGVNLAAVGLEHFLTFSIFMRAGLYGCWSLLYFGIHAWLDGQKEALRAAQAEAALRSSELQFLRAQVNPHFLFNALNSILSESEDSEAVRRITLALAEYLRFSLAQSGDTQELGRELAALENYLRIEKTRFDENFEYSITTDARATSVFAPVALVQPLLENAIKFGQRAPARPLKVEVTTNVVEDRLVLEVANTGAWVESTDPASTGLANLRRRLHLLYENAATLTHEHSAGWVRVRVCLPVAVPR